MSRHAWIAVVIAACSSNAGPKGPVTIALLTPKTGALSSIGVAWEHVFGLAVDSVNNQGGIDGRTLQTIVIDTPIIMSPLPSDKADVKMQEAIDMGAVGVVGPAISDDVALAYPVGAAAHVPLISPSSTAPYLSKPEPVPGKPDDGYMFRNVPDDTIQGIAIAYFLGQKREPSVANVAVLYENDSYGDGLRAAFVGVFTGAPTQGKVDVQVPFATGLSDADATNAIANLATSMKAQASPPTVIVMIALEQDAIKLANAWDKSTDPIFAGSSFFFTDGARSSGFLAGAPASVRGMCGTAPTFPVNGLAYGALARAFAVHYPTENLDDVVYAPNVWDATHLLAAALVRQGHDFPDEALGGADLRDEITAISKTGQIVRADQWRTLLQDVLNGTDIDYDGAAGPNDFDVNGQAIGPYEVWCVTGDGSTFDQLLFLDAQALEAL